MSTESPILIVGAGIGGLSAAIHLAAAGQRVVVVEQNDHVGGKMGEIRAVGYRWDTGPSVITMRHVFEDLFAHAGRELSQYLTLQPVDPLTRYIYPDGTVLDVTRDLPHMLDQIAALDQRDVEGYLRFLAYAARLHRITGPVFIYDQPPTWRSFLRVSPRDALRVDGVRTMARAARSFVRSPHLRQLLGRFATYVGASPYQAPATLNVIAHVELSGGVWYPQGGIYA
ncbi:MAG: FAD-dependent oxidoreductase, partial [Chloroflexi bacterium]|nr:FAD-dependent oxidoreductase [Chloroflexota bacterium]